MPFLFSKEAKEQRTKEKELKRQKEIEQREAVEQLELKRKTEYCNWYSLQTQKFVDEISNKGFNCSWGFEVEPYHDMLSGIGGKKFDSTFVFDVPALEAVAFDMNSKRMLYFTCDTGYYEKYKNPETEVKYTYVLIPFSDIFNASVEVDSQTTISTATSRKNVIGRSIIGGLLAGDAGAIIGGTTGKSVSESNSRTIPQKVVFSIQTTYPDLPFISFEFSSIDGTYSSNKSIFNTMYGIFSNTTSYVDFHEYELSRKCSTSTDYRYKRIQNIPKHDGNIESKYNPMMDSITKFASLDIILKRLNEYVMQIQTIIKECDKEVAIEPSTNVISELSKLVDMREKGFLTEEEFVKLKAKLM